MGSGTPSDLLLDLARRLALGSFALAAGISFLVMWLRFRRTRREARRTRFEASWDPVLLAAIDGSPPGPLPAVPRADRETFLLLWNHRHEVLAGEVHGRLDAILRDSGVLPAARRMLRGRGTRRRLLGVQTAGNLRDRDSWEGLAEALRGGNSYLALCAARALVRIDPARAVPLLVPQVVARVDWSQARAAQVLSGAPAALWTPALAEELLRVPPPVAPRLLRLLEEGAPGDGLPAIRKVFHREESPEIRAAALHAFGTFCDPSDLERVRSAVQDRHGVVRMRALEALGRMGTEEDAGSLRTALADPEWWVRYRAAGSLARIPGGGRERLAAARAATEDPAARAILDLVLAEEGGA